MSLDLESKAKLLVEEEVAIKNNIDQFNKEVSAKGTELNIQYQECIGKMKLINDLIKEELGTATPKEGV